MGSFQCFLHKYMIWSHKIFLLIKNPLFMTSFLCKVTGSYFLTELIILNYPAHMWSSASFTFALTVSVQRVTLRCCCRKCCRGNSCNSTLRNWTANTRRYRGGSLGCCHWTGSSCRWCCCCNVCSTWHTTGLSYVLAVECSIWCD